MCEDLQRWIRGRKGKEGNDIRWDSPRADQSMQFYVQVSYNGKGVVVTSLRCDLVPARSELTIDLTLNAYYTLHATPYTGHGLLSLESHSIYRILCTSVKKNNSDKSKKVECKWGTQKDDADG
jgi:hypothetical protein